MKVSVAMTTYNGEKHLLQQLKSLLAQTRQPDEVIIVDDASTDQTVDLLLAFIYEHELDWKVYINRENLGYRKNFQEVLKKTTGDYIFVCDQDDVWSKKKIHTMMSVIERHPEIECLTTSFKCIDEKNNKLKDPISLDIPEKMAQRIPFESIIYGNISVGSTCCFTKKMRDFYLSFTRSMTSFDWEINTIASIFNGLFYLNIPLVFYRIHKGKDKEVNLIASDAKKEAIETDNYLASIYVYHEYMNENKTKQITQLLEFSRDRISILNTGSKSKLAKFKLTHHSYYKKYNEAKGYIPESK